MVFDFIKLRGNNPSNLWSGPNLSWEKIEFNQQKVPYHYIHGSTTEDLLHKEQIQENNKLDGGNALWFKCNEIMKKLMLSVVDYVAYRLSRNKSIV